ncbi:unnamed protein product [Dracunculus medinensis]|uniref:G_PROTEIN_RECEP_F1_2 domain-containing protein n=1 Tax=Dracunculus medinensis TaxID=318479 RepID=A0A0N4UHS8_DRAME|nr:unnamed protein product [Dracunculus medinensis]
MLAGFGRLFIVITTNTTTTLSSMRQCAMIPWNVLQIWAEPLSAMVLLIISVDRLASLVSPLKYRKYGRHFQIFQVSMAVSIVASLVLPSWIHSWGEVALEHSPICWTASGIAPKFNTIFFLIRIICSSASVVVYVILWIIFRHYFSERMTNNSNSNSALYLRMQRRFTVTMGIWGIFTMILYVLPVIITSITNSLQIEALNEFATILLTFTSNINPVVDLIVLLWRQNDINSAMAKILPFVKIFRHKSTIDTSLK